MRSAAVRCVGAVTDKDVKPFVNLFEEAATGTNIYRLTLRDGGDTNHYRPLLEIPEVASKLLQYGHVYNHLLITCPSRWTLQLSSMFKLPAHVALHPAHYIMATNGSTSSSLLDDSHHEPMTPNDFKDLLHNRGIGGDNAGVHSYNQATDGEQALHLAVSVQAHNEKQALQQANRVRKAAADKPLYTGVKAYKPPAGHTVDPASSTRACLTQLVLQLEHQFRHDYLVWSHHVAPPEGANAAAPAPLAEAAKVRPAQTQAAARDRAMKASLMMLVCASVRVCA